MKMNNADEVSDIGQQQDNRADRKFQNTWNTNMTKAMKIGMVQVQCKITKFAAWWTKQIAEVAPYTQQKGWLSVLFAHTTIMQIGVFCAVCPKVWNGLNLDLRHLPRTLSDTFINHLKLLFSTMLESGALPSSFLVEVLYKSLNEWMNKWNLHARIALSNTGTLYL